MPTTTEQELDTVHSNEPAAIEEGSSKVVLDADTTGGIEFQSELEETLTPSAPETRVDIVSSNKDAPTAVVAYELETQEEAERQGINAATATNDLAAEFSEMEQPIFPTTEVFSLYSCGNVLADPVLPQQNQSTKLVDEAAIVAVGLAAAEGFSSTDKAAPEGIREASPEAVDDSVESGTTLNMEPHREPEVEVSAPETEDTPDIHSSLSTDPPTSVPLPLEPESSLIETELVAERHIETSSTATKSVPTDAEVQPEPSLIETAPNAIEEVQTQVSDTNTKDELILESDVAQHIEAADAELEAPLEDVAASSTKESQSIVQMEPEVDFVALAEEDSLAITQVAAEDLSPKNDIEEAISQTPLETIPIEEDATASVANVEDQIISPVDVRSEHAAVVETSSTDETAEVILPPNVEESPETSAPLVEPRYKNSDDEIVSVNFFLF